MGYGIKRTKYKAPPIVQVDTRWISFLLGGRVPDRCLCFLGRLGVFPDWFYLSAGPSQSFQDLLNGGREQVACISPLVAGIASD